MSRATTRVFSRACSLAGHKHRNGLRALGTARPSGRLPSSPPQSPFCPSSQDEGGKLSTTRHADRKRGPRPQRQAATSGSVAARARPVVQPGVRFHSCTGAVRPESHWRSHPRADLDPITVPRATGFPPVAVLRPLAPWLGPTAFRDVTSGAPRTERLVFVAAFVASAVVAAARGRCPRSAGRRGASGRCPRSAGCRGASGRCPYRGRCSVSEMRARAALSAPPASRTALAALWPRFLCIRSALVPGHSSLSRPPLCNL